MAPKLKLIYFAGKGRGEPMRLCCAYAGLQYEDFRIAFEDWPKHKADTPMGTVPVLEIDGKPICQTLAIMRYLGKLTGLGGSTDIESAEIDMFAGGVEEFWPSIRPYVYQYFGKDPEAPNTLKSIIEKFKNENLPMWEKFLANSKSGFLVNDKLSYADLMLFNIIDIINERDADALKNFQKLQNVLKVVGQVPKIKEYLAERPEAHM